MINIKNEFLFLLINIRAFISFELKKFLNYLYNGHFVRATKIKKYINNSNNKKIHLGSNYNLQGYLNSQILSDVPIDICKKLPFENNSIDLIFSCHVVEHIHYKEFQFFLKESFRVLKKNGTLIITTPSLKKMVEILYGRDEEKKSKLLSRQNKIIKDNMIKKNSAVQINIVMRGFGHRFIYDFDLIKDLSDNIGFNQCVLESENNLNKFDKNITDYLISKGVEWNLETETYCLVK